VRWWKGALGLERDGPTEQKDIMPWRGGAISTENGDNFIRNQATVAELSDTLRRGCDNALGLSAVWACINLLAGTISSLPLMVYQDVNGVRRVARDHPLYWLLHDSPNFDQTAVDFWEFMAAGIELQGNAYAAINRRGDGFITSLVPIRPDLVRARRLASGSIEYRWTADGREVVRPDKQVLHIRGPLGDALSGVSTLGACRNAFDSAIAANAAAEAFFNNGIRASGVLSTDPSVKFNPEQRATLEKLLHEKFRGAMNAGRPMLLDGGLKWEALSLSPEDAQMIETRSFSVEEICRVFGVPPHMVGHSEKSTSWGSGLEQQTLGFVKFSLRRRLKRIEQALEKQLLTKAERDAGVTIEFNLEGLLRGDSKGRSDFYKTMTQLGAMTINEVRALENMPPVEGGDVPRMQMQNVPITEAGQEPVPGE
jgi:HK97 family phage portal protein